MLIPNLILLASVWFGHRPECDLAAAVGYLPKFCGGYHTCNPKAV